MDFYVCRHELPVTSMSPVILVNDEEFLVVDKPASIPIHPCGRYRHNSLLYILAKEHGFRNLRCKYALHDTFPGKLDCNASVVFDQDFLKMMVLVVVAEMVVMVAVVVVVTILEGL